VLDDVQRRRFLVHPAREDPLPAVVRPLHVELQEGAGQLLRLPRRGRLARPQAHDGVADAHRLARPQHQVADDAVALVQKADDGDPLRHRRDARLLLDRLRQADGVRLSGAGLPVRGRVLSAASGDEQQRSRDRDGSGPHAQSGVQAS
jgi:hypothetical protein